MECRILASGSKGNSFYIASDHVRILIDAGMNFKHLENKLKKMGVSPGSLSAIFITHEHGDHTQGVGIANRYQIPVFATPGTWKVIKNSVREDLQQVISKEHCIKDVCVRPYPVPHDAYEPVGYTVSAGRKKISITLDLGYATEKVIEAIRFSDLYIFEANHDGDMLQAGEYPESLKARIQSENGHISNADAGKALTKVLNGFGERVVLAHLSHQNNLPMLAKSTVSRIFQKAGLRVGKDVQLHVFSK
jgi:phosphoribosyl 1,2-cyclic phosphodiesterase